MCSETHETLQDKSPGYFALEDAEILPMQTKKICHIRKLQGKPNVGCFKYTIFVYVEIAKKKSKRRFLSGFILLNFNCY